jgi:hypothetical protein
MLAANSPAALPFAPKDIEEICDLEPGTLTGETADRRAMPVLKKRTQGNEGNVVSHYERGERSAEWPLPRLLASASSTALSRASVPSSVARIQS